MILKATLKHTQNGGLHLLSMRVKRKYILHVTQLRMLRWEETKLIFSYSGWISMKIVLNLGMSKETLES